MHSRITPPVRSCPHDKEKGLTMNTRSTIPTLQDVLDAIEQLGPGTRKRDLKSAVSSFCKAVGKSPHAVLAHPKDIRPLREAVAPLLGHTSLKTTEKCYRVAQAQEGQKRYIETLENIRRPTNGKNF